MALDLRVEEALNASLVKLPQRIHHRIRCNYTAFRFDDDPPGAVVLFGMPVKHHEYALCRAVYKRNGKGWICEDFCFRSAIVIQPFYEDGSREARAFDTLLEASQRPTN